MNLLRSICCLFGSRCAPEEAKSAGDTMRAEQSVPADLGQKEADLEKTGKEQMSEAVAPLHVRPERRANLLKVRHSCP